MNIYVGNLSYDATDVTIREAFETRLIMTLCKMSAPLLPFPTGSRLSNGKFVFNISSNSSSKTSPCNCCEPCSAFLFKSSFLNSSDPYRPHPCNVSGGKPQL